MERLSKVCVSMDTLCAAMNARPGSINYAIYSGKMPKFENIVGARKFRVWHRDVILPYLRDNGHADAADRIEAMLGGAE